MSTNTGVARSYSTQLAEATKLNGDVITSSPSPSSAALTHRCRPLVPLLTAIANRLPVTAQTACSNSGSLGPRLKVDPERTSSTAERSSAVISGLDKGTEFMKRLQLISYECWLDMQGRIRLVRTELPTLRPVFAVLV